VQSNFITHYPPGVVIVIILLGGSIQAFSEIPQQCCLLEASDVAPRDRGWATAIPEPIDQGQGWLAKEDRFPWCYFNAFAIELLFVIVQHDMKDHVSHIPQLITEILYPVPKRVKLIYEYRSLFMNLCYSVIIHDSINICAPRLRTCRSWPVMATNWSLISKTFWPEQILSSRLYPA
jgi:hypothetical protein